MDPIVLPSLLVSFSLFMLFVGAVAVFRSRSGEIAGRFAQLPVPSLPVTTALGRARARPSRLSRLLATGTAPDLPTEMARADLRFSPAEWVAINFLTMTLGFVLGFLLLHQNLLLTIAGGFLGLMAPRFYLRFLQSRRQRAFDKQLPDTITLMGNSLRSGYSLLQSMETVSRELKPPISAEFGRVVREVGMGLTAPDALGNLLRRVPSDDLDFLITAINIQHEVGGNLAQVLDVIAHTIRERVRILGEIRVLTTQQRLSALILILLPLVAALGIYILNPGYMSMLWTTTCGFQMLLFGGVLMVFGYIVVQRIANIEV